MNQGTLTITFGDIQTDTEVEMTLTRMTPQEALYTRRVWLDRFAALHMGVTPTFDYDGPDYDGEWEDTNGKDM